MVALPIITHIAQATPVSNVMIGVLPAPEAAILSVLLAAQMPTNSTQLLATPTLPTSTHLQLQNLILALTVITDSK